MDGVLVINKECDMTSRDVVNKLNRILHTKRIGHTGTLDPLATGVLVVCVGSATKLVELLTSDTKEYIAEIVLGSETDTLDITGEVLCTKDFSVNYDMVVDVLNSFMGKSIQEVPKYSAISVNGKRLYEYARNGDDVVLPSREIEVLDIELLEYCDGVIKFRVVVSKGTYIRSLIRDISYKLGTVGTMKSLVRTKQGLFNIDDAIKLSDVCSDTKLITIDEVLSNFEKVYLDIDTFNKVKNGSILEKNFNGDKAVYIYEDRVVAIYKVYEKDDSLVKPYKMFL